MTTTHKLIEKEKNQWKTKVYKIKSNVLKTDVGSHIKKAVLD
jgi:hypothetical protein